MPYYLIKIDTFYIMATYDLKLTEREVKGRAIVSGVI